MVVSVLFITGDHVPVIPLVDVVGNAAIVTPVHTASTCVKFGVVGATTFTAPEIAVVIVQLNVLVITQ